MGSGEGFVLRLETQKEALSNFPHNLWTIIGINQQNIASIIWTVWNPVSILPCAKFSQEHSPHMALIVK